MFAQHSPEAKAAKALFGNAAELEVEAPAGWETKTYNWPTAKGHVEITFEQMVAHFKSQEA